MTKPPNNPSISKSKALICLEYALLALYLCVIALRTIYTEGPAMRSMTMPTNLGDNLYSLSISACLFFSFLLWIVWNICSRRLLYRPTGIELGLCLFFIAAVISCFAASDKRLAITNIVVFISPLLCFVLLVQILDSPGKVKLVLAVIAALGVLSAYQCIEQLLTGNQAMIEQYQENPQNMLEPLGIEPDTLQHFFFEHRLFAGNIRAYFTTRNSAGSFLLLSFFAALALFIDKFRDRHAESRSRHYIACAIPIAVILVALALTKSKGANIGLIFAVSLLVMFLCFGKWLRRHKKIIFIACILLTVSGSIVIVRYGLKYDRLPGGNSMLVRWQYWRASAKMYADHSLTGVGPGNFTGFYSHYKPASALESVSDPHNFPLSILTQYGPLGLVGFLAMIIIPLWKIAFPKLSASSAEVREKPSPFKTPMITFLLILWLGLMLAQLLIMPAVRSGELAVVIYVITRFFIPAMVVFIISFLLFGAPGYTAGQAKRKAPQTNLTAAVLFCGLLGVILHNMTDFAIFEPGVYIAFWAIIACVVAVSSNAKSQRELVLKPAPVVKILTIVTALVVCWAFLNFAFIPVALTTDKIEKSNQAISYGRLENAHSLLDSAAGQDSLSPVAPSLNARLYLYHSQQVPDKSRELLTRAEKCLKTAIERNNSDFKNFERLAEVYLKHAEISTGGQQADLLNKAFKTASDAVERYPGCGRLHFNLAQIAEKMEKNETAIEHYEKAIDIENQYRRQFKTMYPQRKEIISRLGEEKYKIAIERAKKLSSTP